MCDDNESREERRRRLLKFLEEAEESSRLYREFKKLQAEFAEDLIISLGMAMYDYFSSQPAHPKLALEGEISEEQIIEQLAADKDIQFYSLTISEELDGHIWEFSEENVPAERKLRQKKIEYRMYNHEAVLEQAQKTMEESNITEPEDQKLLLKYYEEDALIDDFYANFDMLLHKTLKKLALKYFPEIAELSATGLREIDYLLYSHMRMMRENILKTLQGVTVRIRRE